MRKWPLPSPRQKVDPGQQEQQNKASPFRTLSSPGKKKKTLSPVRSVNRVEWDLNTGAHFKRLYYMSIIERPVSAEKVIYHDYVDTTVMDREGCGHGVARGNIAKDIRIPENFHSDWRVSVEGPKFCTPFPASASCSTHHILFDVITLILFGTF